jgi:Xaa-Pro aminopeptidase
LQQCRTFAGRSRSALATVLEPGMVISVEPMFATGHGYFDLEDQYLVTEHGAECLHELAPERMPVI